MYITVKFTKRTQKKKSEELLSTVTTILISQFLMIVRKVYSVHMSLEYVFCLAMTMWHACAFNIFIIHFEKMGRQSEITLMCVT